MFLLFSRNLSCHDNLKTGRLRVRESENIELQGNQYFGVTANFSAEKFRSLLVYGGIAESNSPNRRTVNGVKQGVKV